MASKATQASSGRASLRSRQVGATTTNANKPLAMSDEALPSDAPLTKADKESRDISRVLSQLIYGGVLFSIMLLGIGYAIVNFEQEDNVVRARTPASTTHLHSKLPSYFSDKRNLLNQVFVKKAWGWTTAAFIALLAARPSHQSPSHFVKPILRYLMATAYWLLFTAWFFGPSLSDRVLVLTGAKCLPATFMTDKSLSPDGINASLLDPDLCMTGSQAWKAMSKSSAEAVVAGQGLEGLLHARPYWHGGHDISGHTFLLVHASLFLIAEIAPLVPLLIGTQDQRKLLRDWQRLLAYGALAIQGLWAVMLFATSIYFHSPPEKFTGFIVGALGPVFSNYIIGT